MSADSTATGLSARTTYGYDANVNTQVINDDGCTPDYYYPAF